MPSTGKRLKASQVGTHQLYDLLQFLAFHLLPTTGQAQVVPGQAVSLLAFAVTVLQPNHGSHFQEALQPSTRLGLRIAAASRPT